MTDPKRLYLGDNGRLFCGAQACAGMTAYATGRDLSGQPVEPLSAEDAKWLKQDTGIWPACETCGTEARLVA